MKMKCYHRIIDEDTGEYWLSFLGHVMGENYEQCRGEANIRYGRDSLTFPVGKRIKLRGRVSERIRAAELRRNFAAMCPAEQAAYIGE